MKLAAVRPLRRANRLAMVRCVGEQAIHQRLAERQLFWGLMALAAMARAVQFDAFSAHHPDELMQYLEQAHRLWFGYGIAPWEYRFGIRSWLIPLLLVPPMAVGDWLDPGGALYLVLPRAMIAAVSLLAVAAAWRIGRRRSLDHALVAAAVMAIWIESVEFGAQLLTESLAASLFLFGASYLRRGVTERTAAVAGALIAAAGLVRFQYGPAMALFVLVVAGRDWRMWRGLLLGGLPVLGIGALVDIVMGGLPFGWIIANYAHNISGGAMRRIAGVGDPWGYARDLWSSWQWATLIILPCLAVGWRQHPGLAVGAVANLLLHQFIDHKEYRYIWLSVEIALLLAALGSVDILERRPWANKRQAMVIVGLVGVWATMSALLAMTHAHRRDFRTENVAGRLAAAAAADPASCALIVPRLRYWQFPYVLVHRDEPVFLLGSTRLPSRSDPGIVGEAANRMIAFANDRPPPGWSKSGCVNDGRQQVCLYERPGGCRPSSEASAYLFQPTLDRVGM